MAFLSNQNLTDFKISVYTTTNKRMAGLEAAESESSGDDQRPIPVQRLSGTYTIEGFRDAFVVATTFQPETVFQIL